MSWKDHTISENSKNSKIIIKVFKKLPKILEAIRLKTWRKRQLALGVFNQFFGLESNSEPNQFCRFWTSLVQGNYAPNQNRSRVSSETIRTRLNRFVRLGFFLKKTKSQKKKERIYQRKTSSGSLAEHFMCLKIYRLLALHNLQLHKYIIKQQ